MNLDKFHVIAVVSNPRQYESRYETYKIFEDDIVKKGATLWTVELIHGARAARITRSDEARHIQLWQSATTGELWHKENMINIALQFITRHAPDWRYVAWVDADFKFEAGAIEKTVDALQTWDVVQMYSHLVNFDPDGGLVGNVGKSFMYCYWNNIKSHDSRGGYFMGGSPGGAWAARREALNKMGCTISGPVLDFAILGSGDRNFAYSLVGIIEKSLDPRFTQGYLNWMYQYQFITDKAIRRNVGYVDNTVRHLWHGRKQERGYSDRWEILVDNKFNPDTDLRKDVSGLWVLNTNDDRQIKLRDDIRKYFQSRNEDANTL